MPAAGSRARRRRDADFNRQKNIVEAFLKASREGDFEGLLAVLDPDVVLRADDAAQRLGSLAEIRGAAAVAETFKGRAQAAKPALVDGTLALAVILGGQLRIVLRLTIAASGYRDRCRGGRRTIGEFAYPLHEKGIASSRKTHSPEAARPPRRTISPEQSPRPAIREGLTSRRSSR